MSYFNEQPNRANGNKTFDLQQSSIKESRNKIYNVILTICQITENHKCELTDNSIEVFNFSNIDYKIKNKIDQLLKPNVFVSKKINMPIFQDIIYLEVDNYKNPIPLFVIELPICLTFFPEHNIGRVKNKTKYILILDAKDFAEIFKNNNTFNLANKLRDIRNSKIENPLKLFKDYLINFT
jgi:hypothetical protein